MLGHRLLVLAASVAVTSAVKASDRCDGNARALTTNASTPARAPSSSLFATSTPEETLLESMIVLPCLVRRAQRVSGEEDGRPRRDEAVALTTSLFALEQQLAFGLDASFLEQVRSTVFGKNATETLLSLSARDSANKLLTLGRSAEDSAIVSQAKGLLWHVAGDNYFSPLSALDLDRMEGVAKGEGLGFDYTFERAKCLRDGTSRKIQVEAYMAQAMEEQRQKCSINGGSYLTLSRGTCGAQSGVSCPEGMGCGQKIIYSSWAPAIFLFSYVSAFLSQAGLLSLVGHTALAAVLPVDPWAILITGALASKKGDCTCLPRACEKVEIKGGAYCGIKVSSATDIQIGPPAAELALPHPGSKCVFSDHERQCRASPCEAKDFMRNRKVGIIGEYERDTYNCLSQWAIQDPLVFQNAAARRKVYEDILETDEGVGFEDD